MLRKLDKYNNKIKLNILILIKDNIYKFNNLRLFKKKNGDGGLGIGDGGLGPIPNPQSPIPNPQSPLII